MSRCQTGHMFCGSIMMTVVLGTGCIPPMGGGGGDGNTNVNGSGGTIGDGQTGGFQDNGLEAPASQAISAENLPPTGDLLAPIEGPALPRGEVGFLWEAADPNETNVDSTIFIKDDQDVFNNPLFTTGVRTSPEELEHRLSIRFPDAGTFFWGLEVTDGVSTIRRPTSEVGEMFAISEDVIDRGDAAGVVLFCPRGTQPALPRTTFSWSLGDTVPIRTQVFVGRAGTGNPFDATFRVLDVADPMAESRALSEEEALPVGEMLSWGLRIETAEEVLFTFDGQAGESFLVAENVPPTGVLTGPADGSVLADNTTDFTLVWTADSGNCEDDVESTVFFELLPDSEEPSSLFDSPIQLSILEGVFQADLTAVLDELNLTAGTWAWGVRADDGSDNTPLLHSELPDRTFRTFFRNTAPRFIGDPPEGLFCGAAPVVTEALAFSYADDNGVDTVEVTVTFAAAEEDVFDNPAASMTLPTAATGEFSRTEIVFLEATTGADCPEFLQGAGFYGVEINDGVNDPARDVVPFAGPPVGACCHSGGSCTEGTEEDCLGLGGAYQGDDTTCASVSCPLPPPPPIADCDADGISDSEEILSGSFDCNLNGVPDECEGSPTVVDAGSLAPGTIDPFSNGYDSTPNQNDLIGTICPPQTAPAVAWTFESGPLGVEVFIRDPSSLSTSYLVSPALAGDYVFRLTLSGTSLSDTVTLTLMQP